MEKLAFVILLFMVWQCNSPEKRENAGLVYIYDSEGIMEVHDLKDYLNDDHYDSTIIRYVFRKSVEIPKYLDTFFVGNFYKHYSLMFYMEYYLNVKAHKDTFFYKTQSYLNQIEFFDSKWLKNEERVDSFWTPIKCWRCSGKYDKAKIFLILPVEKTDSVLFMQVHRWYNESVD